MASTNSWAAAEARWAYKTLGLEATLKNTDIGRVSLPGRRSGILSAFTANELDEASRRKSLQALLDAADRGAALLVVEPIARKLTPWWNDWADAFEARVASLTPGSGDYIALLEGLVTAQTNTIAALAST